jgi:uncharacterized membrane protein
MKEAGSMKSRAEIKKQAKTSLSAQYGVTLGAFILFMIISGAASGITFGLGGLLIVPVLMVGFYFFNVRVYRGENGEIGDLFSGFKQYGRNLGGVLWMDLFIYLWSLLLIIPGIIKCFSYFMTPYILADCPNVKATQALKLSMRMTKGYKGDIFVMMLSFIGWGILCSLTFGILYLFYVGPYMNLSFAGMYEELKKNALEKGVVSAEELA